MPKAEVIVWSKLKGRQILGHKFRRQFAIDLYIVDFYCPELHLAIEIDGESHTGNQEELKDSKGQTAIEARGIKVIRFTNPGVYENIDGIVETIVTVVEDIEKKKIDLPKPLLKKGGDFYSCVLRERRRAYRWLPARPGAKHRCHYRASPGGEVFWGVINSPLEFFLFFS
jgi:very-short-patch-repair endonuclease